MLRLSIFFTLSQFAYSGELEEKKTPLIPFKEVSKFTLMEGQYIFISKNQFFFEGRILSQKQVIASAMEKKIKGSEKIIALYQIKGAAIKDYVLAQKELSNQGFTVCLSSHQVDLNLLYTNAAKAKTANRSK